MLLAKSRVLVQFLFIQHAFSAYDYVVVGGGNGGLVVASRLSEDPNVNVIVLEAGPSVEDLPEVYIPGMIGAGKAFTSLNWAYRTVPQQNMNGRHLSVAAGKALGGSTIINSMIQSRATKTQYDALGTINNSTAWTWDAMLPFFKRSEIFTPPNDDQKDNGASYDPAVHGPSSSTNPTRGRVKAGFPNFFFPQSQAFTKALIGLRFKRALDLSNGDIVSKVGVSSDTLDATNNTRCSAVCGYVTPFANGKRPNLQVVTGAMASKIIWDEEKKTKGLLVAKRVEYFVDGDSTPKYADIDVETGGEVVMAAGTIGTPKIMELSGVGKSSLLKGVGVDVVLDLPSIGENLADHIHSWANAVTNATITKDILRRNEAFKNEQLILWHKDRTGFYSAAPRPIGLAAPTDLLPQNRITPLLNDARRDLDLYATKFSNGNNALKKGIKTQHEIALSLYEKDQQIPIELNFEPGYSGPTSGDDRNFSTISAVFYSPLSRGRTHITSTNHTIAPSVDPAYWSHPIDVAMLVAGVQTARKALRAPPLNSIYVEEYEPGLKVGPGDEGVEAWLRNIASSDSHEVGTMAMMPRSLGGVVDPQLKVYGLENVRVADASILPMPISAHLMSTVYVIGEKAADYIKKDRQRGISPLVSQPELTL